MKKQHIKIVIISSLYEQWIIFESKTYIININSNQCNIFCLYYLDSKDLVYINYLLFPFFYAIISVNTNTKKILILRFEQTFIWFKL